LNCSDGSNPSLSALLRRRNIRERAGVHSTANQQVTRAARSPSLAAHRATRLDPLIALREE